jgi:septal ring factor EnvC (AmiA/AmiB activator)
MSHHHSLKKSQTYCASFPAATAPEQIKAEINRLQQLLQALQSKDAELQQSIKPHPRDTGGWFLKQMWPWREQRQAALVAEIHRLAQQLVRLEAAYRVYAEPKPQAVYDRLLAWMQEQGAVVGHAHVKLHLQALLCWFRLHATVLHPRHCAAVARACTLGRYNIRHQPISVG